MKKKNILILIFSILLLPNIVNARKMCEYDDKTRLQRIASNIASSYTYKEEKNEETGFNTVKFTVTLTNMHDDVVIIDEETNEHYYNNADREIVIENVKPGKYLKFLVYGNIDNCREEKVTTIYVTLPSFNKYYTDELCRNIPDYSLCNKWANIKMTHEKFTQKVQAYLDSLIVSSENTASENQESVFEIIIAFLAKYSLIIFGSIIIICAGLIFYLVRKDDFDLSIK